MSARHLASAVLGLAALAPSCANAQAHQTTAGAYTLRSSTVGSETIAPSAARAHHVTPSPDVAVLNITVTEKGKPGNGTVKADVVVRAKDITGRAQPIEVTEDRENGYVSYFGTYRRRPNQTYRFEITAIPQGTHQRLALRYQEQVAGT